MKITDKQIIHFFTVGWLFYTLMIVFNDYDLAAPFTALLFLGKEIHRVFINKGFNVPNMVASLVGMALSFLLYDLQLTHNIFGFLQ